MVGLSISNGLPASNSHVALVDAKDDQTPSSSSEGSVQSTQETDESSTDESNGCCAKLTSSLGLKLKEELGQPVREISRKGKNWLRKSMTFEKVKNTFPVLKWLPKYRLKHFQGDLIAGLTVALTVLPQGLAYGQVAELPPQYGLYSAFMGCFIYMVFGSAKDVTLGPTAVMSLLTAQFCRSPIDRNPTYAIILCFITGIIQFFMGIFHIGFVVNYISHPVINGFTTAAAITVSWNQIKKWFGLKKIPREFIDEVYADFNKIPETRLYDFLMGLSCLLVLHTMNKLRELKWGKHERMGRFKRAVKYIVWITTTARNAIVVIVSSLVAAIFIENKLMPFTLTGTISGGLPPFRVPNFTLNLGHNVTQSTSEIFQNIGTGFIIVPLLGIVESIAIGQTFARRNNYPLDANQELLAIGASNIVGAFVGSYPVTGSFSRSAVNAQSGVMTQAGGIWTAALVLLALAFLTPLFFYIPDAALAAVIIMAVIDMIDFSLLWKLWKVKKIDLIPWTVTFVCSLLIGIEYGIITGVGLSLLLLLYPWLNPHIRINLFTKYDEALVMTLSQGLLFPGIEQFKEKIYAKALQNGNEKSVVLDFSHISNVDFTAVEGLHHLLEDFTKKNRQLVVCNLRPGVLDVFSRAKLKHFRYASSIDEAISILQAPVVQNGHMEPLGDHHSLHVVVEDEEEEEEECLTEDDTLERNYIVTRF